MKSKLVVICFGLALLCGTLGAQDARRLPDMPRAPLQAQRRTELQPDTNTAPTRQSGSSQFFDSFHNRFSPTRPPAIIEYLFPVLVIALLVGATVGGIVLYNRFAVQYTTKNGYNSPRLLFNELCTLHQIDRDERRFLRDFAERRRLTNPLPLFIEPRWFLESLEDDSLALHHHTLEKLLIKVFGIPEEWSVSGEWGNTLTMTQTGMRSGMQSGQLKSGQFSETLVMPAATEASSSKLGETRVLRAVAYRWDDIWGVFHRCVWRLVAPWAPRPLGILLTRRLAAPVQFIAPRRGIPLREIDP